MNLPAPRGHVGGLVILTTALEGKAATTQRAYLSDLAAFAVWAGQPSAAEAVAAFLELEPGHAHDAATHWRSELEGQGLAPRSVARKLAALRMVVRQAKRGGHVAWDLDVAGPRIRGFTRNTRAPAPEDVDTLIRDMREAGRAGGGQLAIRDLAIVLLLHDSALRCSEALSLDVRHVDIVGEMVQIHEKGAQGDDRIWWPITGRTRVAVARWLKARGRSPGPLFCSVGIGRASSRISRKTVWRRVVWWAEQSGFDGWRPHGLRKAAGTRLQRATGDLERVRRFLRHRDVNTTSAHYVETEQDAVRGDMAIIARPGRRRK